MFPLAMSHMAMPVTIRGWLLNKMSGPFFRTLPALSYWAFFLLLMMIVPLACIGGAVFMARGIDTLIENSNYNTVVFTKNEEIEGLPKNAVMPESLTEWRGKKEVELDFKPFWIPSGLLVLAAGWFGATAVFLMRANGLYTKYFLDYLDLETMEPEVKYVAKVWRGSRTSRARRASPGNRSWPDSASPASSALPLAAAVRRPWARTSCWGWASACWSPASERS